MNILDKDGISNLSTVSKISQENKILSQRGFNPLTPKPPSEPAPVLDNLTVHRKYIYHSDFNPLKTGDP